MLDIIPLASDDSDDVSPTVQAWRGAVAGPEVRTPRDVRWDRTQCMWSHLAPPTWTELTADRTGQGALAA